jgi:hypothetical protein
MQQIYNRILVVKKFIFICEEDDIGAMTFSLMTLYRMALSIIIQKLQQNSENAIILQIVLLAYDNSAKCHSADCHFAQSCGAFVPAGHARQHQGQRRKEPDHPESNVIKLFCP